MQTTMRKGSVFTLNPATVPTTLKHLTTKMFVAEGVAQKNGRTVVKVRGERVEVPITWAQHIPGARLRPNGRISLPKS